MAEKKTQHIIRKQVIELTIDSRQNSFGLQNKVSEYYLQQIVPRLEKVFDTISANNEVVRIDYVKLDLGQFSVDQFIQEMKQGELLRKLEDKLRNEIRIARIDKPMASLVTKTLLESAFEQWIYYMEKGLLPWNLLKIEEDWRKSVLEELATDYNAVSLLRKSIQINESLLKRIVLQHEPRFLQKLVEILTAVKQDYLLQAMHELQQIIEYIRAGPKSIPVTLTKNTIENIWEFVLIEASILGASGETSVLAEAVLIHMTGKKLPTALKEIPEAFKTGILLAVIDRMQTDLKKGEPPESFTKLQRKKNEIGIQQAEDEEGHIEKISARIDDGDNDSAENNRREEPNKIQTNQEGESEEQIPNKKGKPGEDVVATRTQKIEEEGIFVSNAGIVMAHPFIHSFFKRSNLVSDGRFIDLKAQQKAIYLLHYLCMGQIRAEEYELVMPKILCAYPLELPLEREVTILTEELKEAEDVLNGLINHWGIKNISVEGLRGNFLARRGKLSSRNEQLYMIIEKNAVDILLRTFPLPWNMSIIKLPWQQQAIHIEW